MWTRRPERLYNGVMETYPSRQATKAARMIVPYRMQQAGTLELYTRQELANVFDTHRLSTTEGPERLREFQVDVKFRWHISSEV